MSETTPDAPGPEATGTEVEVPLDPAAQAQQLGTRSGMWGRAGTGDTSGYGGITRALEMPGLAQRPLGGWFDAIVDRLDALVPGWGTGRILVYRDELTLFVRREALLEVARALRDDAQLRFEMCPSVSGVHYPGSIGEELHAVYHLLSVTHNRRIRLEVTCTDADPHIPSIVSVYPHADWHERETWDMFGIQFDGHPSLTRILMPDDWNGHPQRKDYPLGGVPVEYKGAVVPPPDERRKY
ncbi:NADH-quinone oxidoreductase subunit C [Aestuariimicrobium ganziense]|uniref:NADH-quinone oxidoreductase subunit C n=1 Tax=Aestuariimicrobium ganziense TaxID=2773677 RepID=UPI001943A78C|nr:NADH-quinone oxidoreductase subunit C [Aestuariimicrobium ganziense]